MYLGGHVGAALFLYAPAGAVLTALGEPFLAALGAVVAIALSTLPDIDQELPIEHRGVTHTVWFAGAVAVGAAILGGVLGTILGRPLVVAAMTGIAAALSLISHLLADSLTPMGIQPFYPLSPWHHSFQLTLAANPRANAMMLGFGALTVGLCQLFVLL